MNDVFVAADAHGRLDLIRGLIEQAGAERGPGRTIVHLGDLCNCVASSIGDDLAVLTAAPDLFDVLLCGNHEHPYFGGPAFAGFHRSEDVAHAMLRLPWQAAFGSREFLITHAGLAPAWGFAGSAAIHHADVLNSAWAEDPGRHPFFASIGRDRGGNSEWGGILWADWQEPKSTAGFSQIVGHTVGRSEYRARLRASRTCGCSAGAPRWPASWAVARRGSSRTSRSRSVSISDRRRAVAAIRASIGSLAAGSAVAARSRSSSTTTVAQRNIPYS